MGKPLYIRDVILSREPDRQSYVSKLPVVKHLQTHGSITLTSNVTFFVGENGTGKSTLLEAIAVAYGFNPEGGTRNFTFSTNATHSGLYDCLTIAKVGFPKDGFFLRAESVYNMASDIDRMDAEPSFDDPIIGAYGGVSLHEQSHGESFLAIVCHRFFGKGLYILDEPEAALSPKRLLTLMAAIHRLVQDGSQFIIATHSPMLMAFPQAQILEFSQNGICETAYRETEHFKITKSFLENPEKMMRFLFEG